MEISVSGFLDDGDRLNCFRHPPYLFRGTLEALRSAGRVRFAHVPVRTFVHSFYLSQSRGRRSVLRAETPTAHGASRGPKASPVGKAIAQGRPRRAPDSAGRRPLTVGHSLPAQFETRSLPKGTSTAGRAE